MFPKPLPLPENVPQSRADRRKQIVRTSKIGISLRTLIIIGELLGFFYFNSSALLLDAISSVMDVVSSLFLLAFIWWADRPPDEKHPFGHGRFEPIAGLQLGLLLIAVGAIMSFQQLTVLSENSPRQPIDPHTWLIPLCAVVLLEVSYQVLKLTAKKQHSPALLADAAHYRIDALNSLFAAIALGCGAFFPQYSVAFDHAGAVLIALLMVVIGILAARNNIQQLLDRIPDKKFFALVRKAAHSVEGVLATEKMKLQVYGPDAHVSIDVEVDPTLTVEIAHEITQKVRREIQKAWPAVRDVIVHVEPYYPGDHV